MIIYKNIVHTDQQSTNKNEQRIHHCDKSIELAINYNMLFCVIRTFFWHRLDRSFAGFLRLINIDTVESFLPLV